MSPTPDAFRDPDPTPVYFDYPKAAQEAGLSHGDLHRLILAFQADYPDDPMLRELHVLRACHAIARGTTTIAQLLAPPRDSRAA